MFKRVTQIAVVVVVFLATSPGLPLNAATVTIDGSQTYQIIDGFGANINHWNTNEIGPVLDALVDQAGLTLFRVIYDTVNWDTTHGDSVYSNPDWQLMWDTIAYLNQKGITNGVSVNVMGFPPPSLVYGSNPSWLIPGDESAWAQMFGSMIIYARNTCHLKFNLVEPDNEPDNTGGIDHIHLTANQEITALHDLSQLFDANGLSDIRFVGPDLAWTYPQSNPNWISSWLSDAVLMAKVGHIGVHCYNDSIGGPSSGVYSLLQQSGYTNMDFWMTEYNEWCNTCEGGGSGDPSWSHAQNSVNYLLNHLGNGASAGLVFTGCDTEMKYLADAGLDPWSYWGLFGVNNIYAVPKTFSPRKGFYTLSQVSKYVRPGARRIGLSGSTYPFNLLAFYHSGSGQLTLVGVNPSGANSLAASLASLPAISGLDLYYTDSTTNLCWAGSVPVSNGVFSAPIPANCVFTLVSRSGISVLLTNPADGTTYSAGASPLLQASATTSAGTVSNVAFYADAVKLGSVSAAPYSLVWSNAAPGAYALTAWATNSLGNSAVSAPVHIVVIGPPAQILISPTNSLVPPYGTQQFAAAVADALGSSLVPQPVINWSAGAGGSIDSNGLFTAGATPGGPIVVMASSGALSGSAIVNIATNVPFFLPLQANRSIAEQTLLVVTNTAIPISPLGPLTVNSFNFGYANRAALFADGWSYLATTASGATRNTEVTNPVSSSVIYNAVGPLSIPCGSGDLWASGNSTINSLFRSLPTNWLSCQLSFSFSPFEAYQQAQFAIYQNDDNYFELGLGYDSTRGGQILTWTEELNGSPATLVNIPIAATNAYFLLNRNPASSNITSYYSTNGITWTVFTNTIPPFTSPRLAIWTGGDVNGSSVLPPFVFRNLNITVSNAVPRTLAYSLLNPPSGMSINTNGIITWQPTEAQGPGTNIITTIVSDNSAPPVSFTNSFLVVVNEINVAPVLPVQTNRVLAGLQPLVVTNTASDADIPANTLSYSLSGPLNTAIDTNGIITWTPSVADAPSTNLFTTVVTDFNPWAINEQHLSATNTFTVIVYATHTPPTLPVQTNLTVPEMAALVVTNTAATTGLGLIYGLLNPPAGVIITTNGVIYWTPDESQGPGTNTITTIVTDTGVPPFSATNSCVVVVEEINVAPVLPYQSDRSLVGLQPLTVTNTATDSDIPTNTLSYRLLAGPATAAIDTNGVITWTPMVADVPSTNVFTTVVTDYNPWAVNEQHLSATNSFAVVVNAVHSSPVLPDQTNWTIGELTSLVVTNTASDTSLPQPGLAYGLLAPPDGVTITTNGVIYWTPSEAQGPSTNIITTVVTDASVPALNATNSFVVVVEEINVAPVLPYQSDRTLTGLQPLIVTNTATDSDIPTNTLSYQLLAGPATAAVDTNGVITWTPAVVDVPSTNVFTTVVTDYNPWAVNEQHLSATNSFAVVVKAIRSPPILPEASQADPTVAELITLVVTNTAINTDLPQLALTYSLLDPPDGVTITTNGIIYWTPSEAQGPSTNIITTVVTDTGDPPLSATNSIMVVVEEINAPPVLPYQSDRTLTGLQPLIVTNTATDSDIPTNALSYLLTGPATAAIDTNGVITWTPAAADAPSTNLFATVVTDYNPWAVNEQHLSATNTFTVVVAPLPVFSILYAGVSNNVVSLTWESQAGWTYRLQYKNNLGETNWQDIIPDVVAGDSTATGADPLGGGVSRFYRVKLLLP